MYDFLSSKFNSKILKINIIRSEIKIIIFLMEKIKAYISY